MPEEHESEEVQGQEQPQEGESAFWEREQPDARESEEVSAFLAGLAQGDARKIPRAEEEGEEGETELVEDGDLLGGDEDTSDDDESEAVSQPEPAKAKKVEKKQEPKAAKPDEEEAGEDDLTSYHQQMSEMARTIQKLKAQLREKDAEPEGEKDIPLDLGDLVTEEEYDAVMSGVDGLKQFAEKLVKKTVAATYEQVMKKTPGMVANIARQESNQVAMAQEFFRFNPELSDKRDIVAFIAEGLAEKHPDWSMKELFDNLAPEVYKRIGAGGKVPAAKQNGQRKKAKNPGFAGSGGGGRRPQGEAIDSVTKEVREALKGMTLY